MNQQQISLDNWRFRKHGEQEWLTAQVPGCVHTDLLRNNRIGDPFYGCNERQLQWIDKEAWDYETSFAVTPEWLALSNLELVFNGLDTYADVFLNGRKILSADNMFRIWTVDVTTNLVAGMNTLEIRFRSPVTEDLPKLERLGYALPAPNDDSVLGGLDDRKISMFARKAPYHYGWDWGPRFVTCGIWRQVCLMGWSGQRIQDFFIRQDDISADLATLTAILEIESDGEQTGTVEITANSQDWRQEVFLKAGMNKIELPLEISHPRLWWPRGYGEAHRYTFGAVYRGTNGSVCTKEVTTGLRSAKLVRMPDAIGTSFFFEINGIAVYAKGANHIPNHSFATEVTPEMYRHEIASAAESNMNMLRVWGGGYYEEEPFYTLCDEYGIMVWQDFMFACSLYPGDKEFLDNVRHEAWDNVRRLRNHPSIVLYCGNNEIDSAWAHYEEHGGWGWKKNYSSELREQIWEDYEQLFHRILPQVVQLASPGTAYWPSSPLFALTGDRFQHANPGSTSGDVHYWGVWHASEPFEMYKVKMGRFMSEYGFQSFPELASLQTYATEADMALDSEVMLSHQKNGRGNELIKEYMDRYMGEPKDFLAFLYMSQVLQAEAIRMAIEAHRRSKPVCMGSLYWQMNDCWPAASWAGMDFYGRWKAMQFAAKRSFRDILVSIDEDEEGLVSFHVVSDSLTPLDASLRITVQTFTAERLGDYSEPVHLPPNQAQVVAGYHRDALLLGRDPATVVVSAVLEHEGQEIARTAHYFVIQKELKLPQAVITLHPVSGSEGAEWMVSSPVFAKHVRLQAEAEGHFSDNYFDLMPHEPVYVVFYCSGGETPFVRGNPGQVEACSMIDFYSRPCAIR